MIFEKTFKNKKILITGHTGFKGSWLSLWLKLLGADVAGFSLSLNTKKDNFVLTDLEKQIHHHIGDVRDFERIYQIFSDFKPEFVFHLAAQPLVRASYMEPKRTFDTNIGGTVNVLECVRLTDSVKIFINVTTDKCYENKNWVWGYRENDRLGGHDPYSASKAGSEIVTHAYINSFFDPKRLGKHGKCVATVRAGNVIGGGDWSADRLIPDCIRSLEKGGPVIIRNKAAVRPWQHLLEPLSGYLLLASKMAETPGTYEGAWNFGPAEDQVYTVEEVVSSVIRNWGDGRFQVENQKEETLHEADILKLSIEKAVRMLGWKPVWNVETAIRETVKWYKAYHTENMVSFCENQIKTYARLLSNHIGEE